MEPKRGRLAIAADTTGASPNIHGGLERMHGSPDGHPFFDTYGLILRVSLAFGGATFERRGD